MDIDMAALRALEREKEIPFEAICEAIETALLSAYHKTGIAKQHARVELDRSTGHVTSGPRSASRRRPPPSPSRARRPTRTPSPLRVRPRRSPPSSTTRPTTSAASPRRSPAS